LTFGVPLVAALGLTWAAWHFSTEPEALPAAQCVSGPACILAGDLLRDVAVTRYELRRRQFDRGELPVLSLYLSDGALEKLDRKRRDTLAKPGRILLVEDDDWVAARFSADDGKRPIRGKAQLRIKGDWSDHYDHPSKLSFRIKVGAPDYLFGMRRLSIQHPKTRKYQAELLLLDEMRRWGVIAPRYRFVDVRINDQPIGVMAMEEHYSKELLEAQRRREGPIVVLDEDPMWRQRDLNYRVNAERVAGLEVADVNVAPLDMAVRQFRAPPWLPVTSATSHSRRALALYRDYIDGRRSAAETFDLEKMARWWVLTNAWNGCHASEAHNRRFYFNPTTALLEPISFDNLPVPHKYATWESPCDGLVSAHLVGEPRFRKYVLDFAAQLLEAYQDPEWLGRFRARQARLMRFMENEAMPTRRLYVEDVLANLALFLERLPGPVEARPTGDPTRSFPFRYPDAALASHLRAFLFIAQDETHLQLKNLSSEPLRELRVSLVAGREKRSFMLPDLPPFEAGSPGHVLERELGASYQAGMSVEVAYRFRGDAFTETAVLQHRSFGDGFEDALKLFAGLPGVAVHKSQLLVRVAGAEVELERHLALPTGWALELAAGSRLTLRKGATLKLRGPLLARGSSNNPVMISIEPDPGWRGVGAWGGILVLQSDRPSELRHVKVRGAGGIDLPNRQDYLGITGCLTFYESQVSISDSVLSDAHCEDALNVVRADFRLQRLTIDGARADAFDADFSEGEISASEFLRSGNDGVDVSGTTLLLRDTVFQDIGDKAVSVGEQSLLTASGLHVERAGTGVASKDLSRASVTASRFRDISGSGLITYVKKGEYGGAELACDDCEFEAVAFVISNQQGSFIFLDGVSQAVSNFSRVQLAEAGYLGE
jgi:hypothetical protein